ncbi:DPP IV N-terminal domain-containing protein [Roseiflexus sp.]|uniref:DPP IV N-terminal domain-containing protein n=1 Tax=Roseiflexus sp. TaxID=2562120 RepID=UPI002585BF57|nr:DPP IV N-terminal domain-containing protein [Roseiflexus sp.]
MPMQFLPFLIVIALGMPLARPASSEPQRPALPGQGRILFAAARGDNGAFDIFSADLAGERAANLTADPYPDRSPSWSPDANHVVFASRRGDNWDLYVMRADGSDLRRLTNHPAYDGEPSWSPDGRRVAFTSMRDGNPEIYTLDLIGGDARRITSHPAADAQPTWSPDGRLIAFTSWRDGNQEIYIADAESGAVINLTNHPAPDHSPAWSPDGGRIAFISDRDGGGNLHIRDLITGEELRAGPDNLGLRDPAWTPGGGLMAVAPWALGGRRFFSRQGVALFSPGMPGGTFVVASLHGYADPSWSNRAVTPLLPDERWLEGRSFDATAPPVDVASLPRGMVALGDVRAGGIPALAAAVKPSFDALRRDVIEASGYDFLGQLSEASRAVDFQNGTSSFTSWHKAGRAFDTRWDYRVNGQQILYISPEWRAGRLFWRLYLRTSRQDGSMGEPLTAPVFDVQNRRLLPPPAGYFVDFTALAAAHGWNRIAAQERDTFDWRTQLLALEYWHFERRDGLSWYQAMRLVHDDQTLERIFTIERVLEAGARPQFFPFLGLPWAQLPPPVAGPISLPMGRRQ